MSRPVPITPSDAIEFVETDRQGVRRLKVRDFAARKDLSWDRYVRLEKAAEQIKLLVLPGARILDAGGFDGALALFLPDFELDLIDPVTTGASILHEPVADRSYETVVAIDVLEHVPPPDRKQALREFARICRHSILLNYPCEETKDAQALLFSLTGNPLLKEHVDWPLPSTKWVEDMMRQLGFEVSLIEHASVAVWLGQYLSLNLLPAQAKKLNEYLVEHHADEPFSKPLYHMLVCKRCQGDPQ